MKKTSLYLECTSGISGDMAVAALLDLGADRNALEAALDSIPATGFKVEITRVKKSGIDCCDFNVILDAEHENHDHDMNYLFGYEEHEHPHEEHVHHHDHDEHSHHHHEHRGLAEINAIIDGTKMTDRARSLAKKIFMILAEAESKAHGVPLEEVHFHEVGAIDSIVDVIALAVCFESLSASRVYVPFLCEGSGTIRCQHGILSVPVPAVANIVSLHDIPLRLNCGRGEFVTPTGAAFVAAVMTDTELPETFTVKKIGMGAGKRAYERPSIVRAFLIEESEDSAAAPEGSCTESGSVYELETNVDDSTGEQLGFVTERLFEAGALDVFYTPCFMKKNRPAYLLSVICEECLISDLEEIIFCHTTTIGIRRTEYERTVLPRKEIEVKTKWGVAKVKCVTLPNGDKRFYPEYESVAELSRKNSVPYEEAFYAVKEASASASNTADSHGEK